MKIFPIILIILQIAAEIVYAIYHDWRMAGYWFCAAALNIFCDYLGGTMQKDNIKINYEEKLIVVSRKFSDKAKIYNSTEYRTLISCRKDNPGFEIVIKTIRKNNQKVTYKGLSYDFIEKYLLEHNDAENYAEYKLLKKIHRYQEVKKWFLKKYPEISNYMRCVDE